MGTGVIGFSDGCPGGARSMLAHPGGDYAITEMYSVPDDAWYLQLDLVRDQRP
ncbi:hypothetical protein [Streptomyces cyaneofuscatus]|uniref:hypothetical protein n=1 Tax=Streptomyces cyaneofuscatus TaxID=66883 RepID=UPI0037AA5799